MRVEHLAIDGSVVSIESYADLTTGATATGWVIVPSLMRAHPFTIHPAGHSSVVEENVRAAFRSLNIRPEEEYSVKGGKLRLGEVEAPTATGGTRKLTIGAWEGKVGCLTTSLIGSEMTAMVEIFDTLLFSESPRGVAIASPVTARPRVPEVIKEVPGIGVLGIRPAIPSTLERIPKSKGKLTNHGELFRVRATSRALTFVSNSTVVNINPFANVSTPEMMAIVDELRIEWAPGSAQ